MTIFLDLEETETAILLDFTGDLTGRRVLEIGSGDGRLTWRFAHRAEFVTGIEPSTEQFSRALKDIPSGLKNKVAFHNLGLEEFTASLRSQPETIPFDLAILSWSL
jgi:cyclopropane fatty-acyl-phospholipid synthase-like methyltransferase